MIAIGCDQGGYELKQSLVNHLADLKIDYFDFGSYDTNSIDYPLIAEKVGKSVVSGQHKFGVLICGTGIGISIAANKIKGVRAALCSSEYAAKYTRLHNNANVLCLGGRVIGPDLAKSIFDIFISTEFEGGRHQNRLNLISELENRF